MRLKLYVLEEYRIKFGGGYIEQSFTTSKKVADDWVARNPEYRAYWASELEFDSDDLQEVTLGEGDESLTEVGE